MKEQQLPILMNLLAAIAGAGGQYFYKKGGEIIAHGGSWLNLQIVIGVFLFCVVMACFVIGYKLGGRISVVYPFYATTFIWGALIGIGLEKEPWNFQLLIGLALVFAGVSIMALALGKSA
jgi:drug/metabolite transporter (DMT)-like permease